MGSRSWSHIAGKMVTAKLVQLAQHAYRAGFLHLLVSVFLVQGLTYLSQLVIAALMGPADFGVVRSTEVILSLLTQIGTIGMPTMAVKAIAEINNPHKILVTVLGIPMIFTPVTALVLLCRSRVRPAGIILRQRVLLVPSSSNLKIVPLEPSAT